MQIGMQILELLKAGLENFSNNFKTRHISNKLPQKIISLKEIRKILNFIES
jgi:hypothetical protein